MSTKFLRPQAISERVGFAVNQIYKLIAEDKFPPLIKLGSRASGAIDSEVELWAEIRIAKSRMAPKDFTQWGLRLIKDIRSRGEEPQPWVLKCLEPQSSNEAA